MLANFIFFAAVVITARGTADRPRSLDDILGEKYIAREDVARSFDLGDGYGTEWVVMQDGDGNPRVAILSLGNDTESRLAESELQRIAIPVEEAVTLTLFTKSDTDEGQDINLDNLRSSGFDASKPTKIVIHGWQSSGQSDTVLSIRDAYLKRSDVNVLTVDWSLPAGNFFYPSSAAYTRQVGRYLAGIIDQLVEGKGARYEDFHIIGHSLGAHTAGVAGNSTKGKVSRITGLDPARPCFHDIEELENKLDEGDANFVEVIHTCSGALGLSRPVGHADFYPNGGSPLQPGCCCLKEVLQACSHGRSHKYFAESILSESAFEGVKCDAWDSFKANACDPSTRTSMGEHTPTDARGTFYLQTNFKSPFGLGLDGVTFNP